MSPMVRSPSRVSDLLGLLPDAPQRPDRQRVQEPDHLVTRDDEQPVGLGHARGPASPRTCVLATPTEHGSRCSSAILDRISSAIWRGLPSRRPAPATSRNASSKDSGSTSGVIEAKTAMTPREASAYAGGSGGTMTASRAQPPSPPHRHRAVHAVLPRLVGRGEHHRPGAQAADDDGLPAQLRAASQLDAGEEGVHVDVQDRAARVVTRPLARGDDPLQLSAAHDGAQRRSARTCSGSRSRRTPGRRQPPARARPGRRPPAGRRRSVPPAPTSAKIRIP